MTHFMYHCITLTIKPALIVAAFVVLYQILSDEIQRELVIIFVSPYKHYKAAKELKVCIPWARISNLYVPCTLQSHAYTS